MLPQYHCHYLYYSGITYCEGDSSGIGAVWWCGLIYVFREVYSCTYTVGRLSPEAAKLMLSWVHSGLLIFKPHYVGSNRHKNWTFSHQKNF